MEDWQVRPDLIVSGMTTSAGGSFNVVKIDGMGKVNGDLNCVSMDVNGTLKMQGGITGEQVSINGMGTVEGTVECDSLRIDGMATIQGMVQCSELKVNGKGKFQGNVHGERLSIDGSAVVEGDVECELFGSAGTINIQGLLNAGTVEIRLNGSSEVKEIGGEHIRISNPDHVRFWKQLGLGGVPRMKADVIEGDEVYLENTHADKVRGARIYIGRGCKIRQVEYTETYEQDPDASVGSSSQA
ncbi:bactofilin family protein [Paenibacillus sp. CAA11]|uniref:bactofilin family protein n=1 Tax=Paenibacillus sp. CAA11 TaxID=1532905 RepID=UPI001F4020A2|nr:polymer-forming cytoskeletal protein [Paenibacillus sp. CAA11]